MKLKDVPTKVLIGSGKGGVGKTTVASDIAKTAAELVDAVGLIDADISTPNTPQVVGGEGMDVSSQRLATGDALVPPDVDGIQVISQGMVLPDDVPVLRGAQWRAETVADYISNVEWADDTELVVIDSPPGSGGELQTVASMVALDHAYVVTTPHPSSVRDATKTHEFFNQANVPHSVLLNMAYIPHTDIVQHVTSTTDFEDIQGIGEAKAESIAELMDEQAPDFDLFGHEAGYEAPIDAPQAGVIPYTDQFSLRSMVLENVLGDLLDAQEVEA
jgi:Mrp family chromosome partitioning ATPase